MANHQLALGAINLEAEDPTALAKFWAAATGAESSIGEDSVYLPPNGPGGFGMFFQQEAAPRAERQVAHWGLTVPWVSLAAEVERLIGLGAVHQWDVLDEVPHVQWTTLADPEGNLFCVAEHPPADLQRS
ncbi:VOC family protein [Arthrobacter sp. UCD-GKA]|uniref:VOC family protein n=1 Tax=Arthrobacter sp. UCD-GKA TaxID=1913576 RepID=UPI001113A339|nr:VOC family protein [Arthrobacter sp. UCD-GKA]